MQFIRRYRIPALFCALSVLLCELIARPYAAMGICDDGPYVLMARTLASTGHIVYNGWAAAMIVLQLYLGADFIKLFGFSFTAVRSSTLLIAILTAFVLQRTLVRSGINERNATLGTLALVLSPLYLMLSVTFMSDIFGLFAIVLCLYACLRALQSATDPAAIAWLCFAVATNAVFGTSRQIAWLGILVMVPSTLWLLRARRRVLFAGAAITLLGALFILACMQWLKHQPYTIPISATIHDFPIAKAIRQFALLLLDAPFLLLPITVLFLPQIRRSTSRMIAILAAALILPSLFARFVLHTQHVFPLVPTVGDWVSVNGFFATNDLSGIAPVFLHPVVRVLFTVASFGGLIGLIISLLRTRHTPPAANVPTSSISWKQLFVLFAPYSLAYGLLLVYSIQATHYLFDRYLLGLLVIALICIVRYYQERIQPQLPLAAVLLVAATSIYGITVTHNMFSFYRARVALAAEIRAEGIPDTSVDNGWEHNLDVELEHAPNINDPHIAFPSHAFIPPPPPPNVACPMPEYWRVRTPHIHPLYGVSFDPNACYGPAPFAPVHYSLWPASTPGTLYVVHYAPQSKP